MKLLVATLLIGCGSAHAACEAPQQVGPAKSVDEVRPKLSWQAVQRANAYRVKVLSRVPNGKVAASVDTIVMQPNFLLPQPLAEQRAKVVVRVSAICGGETSAEAVASFDIDATPECRLDAVEAKQHGDDVLLQWQAVPGAKMYELRAHALDDGRLLTSGDTRAAAGSLKLVGKDAVVSVRPECASGPGEAVYRVVAAD